MIDRTIELDEHRGMFAQKATDLRRLLADVEGPAGVGTHAEPATRFCECQN